MDGSVFCNFVLMTEKKKKKPAPKKKRGKYTEKLEVKGSFLDIMKAAVKNADKKKS
ncbi:MAG TPA: hypothetical protein VEC12_15005 [Bacteroidia bacterium]|nr:hypothetical protein [Bacteroidia bacterium]